MLTAARLIRYRPWLYHLTSRDNLEAIRAETALHSAASLLTAAGQGAMLQRRRPESVTVHVRGYPRSIRDQAPLHEANIRFEKGTTFGDFIASLNSLIFFWPGTDEGPSEYGVRHFERYQGESPVLLRLPTEATVDRVGPEALRLCRFNSGAPRWSGGRASPRGPSTFLPLPDFEHGVSRVVEVASVRHVPLPQGVEVANRPDGPYRPL